MAASRLFEKIFKRGNRKDIGAYSAAAATSSSPLPSTMTNTVLQDLPPQTASRLVSLPGEIRNKIYDFATYPSLSIISIHRAPEIVLSLPIFAICRQMRSEAISKLCSGKHFSLSGLHTANAFFEMVGEGMGDLRFVTLYCKTDWRGESEDMVVEKVKLLNHLELATSLRSLHIIVGDVRLSTQDKLHLKSASSVGSQFLHAVRSVVDHEKFEDAEEKVIRERFLTIQDQVGAIQAVSLLKEKLKKEHEERAEKVFRVSKVLSLEGDVGALMLPLRLPEYLRKTEEDPRRTCQGDRNYGDDFHTI